MKDEPQAHNAPQRDREETSVRRLRDSREVLTREPEKMLGAGGRFSRTRHECCAVRRCEQTVTVKLKIEKQMYFLTRLLLLQLRKISAADEARSKRL
jgi:hypothetical protein